MIEFITIIRICTYKQTSDRHYEYSDERNTNKRVCQLHSIQKEPWWIMTDDHPAIMFVNFFREKYLLAEMVNTAHIVCRGST